MQKKSQARRDELIIVAVLLSLEVPEEQVIHG
jgi:hypothetical protein